MHLPENHFPRDGLVADARYWTILTRRLDADNILRYEIQNSYGALRRRRAPYGALRRPYGALWRPMAPYGTLRRLRRRPMAPVGAIGPMAPYGALRHPMATYGAVPAWWPNLASHALGLPPLPTRLPSLGCNKNELEIYAK